MRADREEARRKAAEAKAEAKRKADEEKAEARRKAAEERAEAKKRKAEEQKAAKAEAKRKAEEQKVRNAASSETFLRALESATSTEQQIVRLADIARHVDRSLKHAFTKHWQQAFGAQGPFPPGVGSLLTRAPRGGGTTRVVFLLRDIVPSDSTHASAAEIPSVAISNGPPLKDRVLAEFERLNEQRGRHIYVTLFDLRRAVADAARSSFDAALNELRRDGTLTLSPAEGRHETIPPQVLEAGILEQSRLLVYVARRES